MFLKKKRIYLDNAAMTPLDRRVFRYKKKIERLFLWNPSSIHKEGVKVKEVLVAARRKVSSIVGVKEGEAFFTSTGTEANNLALIGTYLSCKRKGKPFHFVTTVIEHPATLEAARRIEEWGGSVTYLPVEKNGIVSPKRIISALTPETRLVSVMYANNEIGTIQPIREIARLLNVENKKRAPEDRVFLHTDAAQAPLFLPIEQQRLGADLISLDAIKIGGAPGAACLIKKQYVPCEPVIVGGGQELGLRSGTENVPSIAAFAYALEIAQKERAALSKRLNALRDFMIQEVKTHFPKAVINGDEIKRLPNNVNACFPGKMGEFMVLQLDAKGVAAATASACKTLSKEGESHVVKAVSGNDCAGSSLRFSFGKETKKAHINKVIELLKTLR